MSTPQDAGRATQAVSDAVEDVRIVGVRRSMRAKEPPRWRREAQLVSELPLEMFVGYKLSIGGTRAEATEEWHVAQQVNGQLLPRCAWGRVYSKRRVATLKKE